MLDSLVSGWINHFWAADHNIKWLHVERPLYLWLDDVTLVVGQCDADGINAEGKRFFGEWKTSGGFDKSTWKQTWRKNPQSLTYGVLYDALYPDLTDFTVRKVFKPREYRGKMSEPSYDHAWYAYSKDELRQWRFQIMEIASEIRAYRAEGLVPWPTNFNTCFQYGPKYECPFFAEGCDKQVWDFVPIENSSTLIPMTRPNPYGTHYVMEGLPYGAKCVPPEARAWLAGILSARPASKELVVLSATAIDLWLRCRERFRKVYEVGIDLPSNEAAQLGGDFHHALGSYYKSLIVTKE